MSINNTQLRLRSQVLQLRPPAGNGGLIWNRPVAVLVNTPDGQERILPVRDVTRVTILALLAFSLGGTLLLMLFRRKTT